MANNRFVLPCNIRSVMPTDWLGSSVKCFHLNVRSLNNKADELQILLDSFNLSFDFVMVSESWLSSSFCLPSFSTFAVNRNVGRGGGVCIFVNKKIECELISELCCMSSAVEVVSVLANNTVYSVFYRPPSGDVDVFFEYIESYISFTSAHHYDVIMGGDFNIDMMSNSAHAIDFDVLLRSFGFSIVTKLPTRITTNSETLIDLFITNINNSVIHSGVICCDLSDHMGIYLFFQKKQPRSKHTCTPMVQYVTPNALENFHSEMSLMSWSDVFNETNAEAAYEKFLSKFCGVYNRHFPLKKKRTMKKIRKPWICNELHTRIKQKNKLYNTYIASKSTQLFQEFKSYRNKLTSDIRNAKKRYYEKQFENSFRHPDKLWKQIRSLDANFIEDTHFDKITHKGEDYTGEKLAEAFSLYFARDHSTPHNSQDTPTARCSSTLFLEPVGESEVTQTFLELSNSTSCDLNNIQIRPVKYVIELICVPLTHIFNLCLQTATFPSAMQIAKVIVLYKKGDKNDFSNYRPISILPVFSKCLEKIILKRMDKFLQSNNIINDSQYGFRKNRSTEIALIHQKEYILDKLEKNKFVLGIFVDFTKAFDCIVHSILFRKLDLCGIRGHALDLIKSYLSHRKQYVQISNFQSKTRDITAGVPQGSILGPLLFNIYINDIANIDDQSRFIIYADDTTILLSADTHNELSSRGNNVLGKLEVWTKENALSVNVNKTKAIIFNSINKKSDTLVHLLYKSQPVEIVRSIKSLGVYFTLHLQWNDHVHNILLKASRAVGILWRHKSVLPLKAKLAIYHALFLSHLNYCTLVWATTTKTNLRKISSLHNKILRLIYNLPHRHTTDHLFSEHEIINVYHLYIYRLLRRYKIEQKKRSFTITDIASMIRYQSKYPHRHQPPWMLPRIRTNYGQQKITYQLPLQLNRLYSSGVNIADITLSQLRQYLINTPDN